MYVIDNDKKVVRRIKSNGYWLYNSIVSKGEGIEKKAEMSFADEVMLLELLLLNNFIESVKV